MGGECCGSGPGSELFEIKKAGDGIWAAVAAPAYKVNCNAAIIETGDGLMKRFARSGRRSRRSPSSTRCA